ncbi:hypothetical protein MtrunA17_Chr4g0035401 [Medicago truncatula]|uniref:Transmembrane protein n=1 Tax=Medicago truncatula TaxID=3880 RepID=A0A396IC82_MEDTR|nr:hypothetical protein MtrunA17_Chr4g0035401 [Medicago truncatula]
MILVQLMLLMLIDVVVDESLLGYTYSWIDDENLNCCWCFGEIWESMKYDKLLLNYDGVYDYML